ncbi:MAG: VOC family protein [Candidatus Binatia bacterium]
MKVKSFRSWNYHADDLEAMTKFYRDVLGGELRTTHTVRGVKVNRLRLGGVGLGLFDASAERADGVPHHTFEIEAPRDPNELVREIEHKGAKVQEVRMHGDGPGYSVYVNDPSGNRLELSVDFS